MSLASPANASEARLAIVETIIDVLAEIDDEATDEELEEIEEGMGELADILLEALGLVVTGVDGDVITCEITLSPVE